MFTALPTLRQLEYVVSVAEHLHFGRAAQSCAVSQPGLSKQIQEVEILLGAPLFERTRPQVQLTPLGEVFVKKARQVLIGARELVHLADAHREPLGGQIHMGAIPTVAPYVLPTLLQRLRGCAPKLQMVLHEAQTEVLLDRLRTGVVDVALLALPIQEGFSVLPLYQEPFVFAAAQGHLLAQESAISERELEAHELLLMEEGHCLREHALSVCTAHGAGMAAEIQASSITTLVLMVAAGLGATLLPALSLPTESQKASGLVLRGFVSSPPPSRTIGLLWRHTSVREPLFRQLGEWLCGALMEMPLIESKDAFFGPTPSLIPLL